MKKALSMLLSSLCSTLIWGQQTAINAHQGHASAILDVSQTSGLGFVPPKVILTSNLTNATNPVNNPVEGLIVYNEGTNQIKGYYIWNKGIWSLLATKENSIANAVFRQINATDNITFSGITFQNIGFLTNQFVNTIPNLSQSSGQFTVPPGSYVVQLIMNVTTTEVASGSIGGRVHAHLYQGRLLTSTNTVLVGPIDVNEISNLTDAKSHMISINFSFKVTQPTTFSLQLARRAGGTYTGNITVKDSFVHIEQSIL